MELTMAVLAAIAIQSLCACGGEPQVSDVLARYAETLERRSCWLHVKSSTFEEWDDPASKEVVRSVAQNEFYRSGTRLNLCLDNFRRVSAVDDANLPPFRRTFQELWDGNTNYHIVNQVPPERSWTLLSKSAHHQAESILAKSYFGAPLEGYFPGHEENILTILREEAPSSTRLQKAVLDGIGCWLVEADIKGRGRYRVWFDPEHGHNICRAEVTREVNNLVVGPKQGRARAGVRRRRTVRFILDKVRFEQSGGVWLPVSGQWQVISIYDNGAIQTVTRYHKCLEAECRPDDLMADDIFVPHVQQGARVYTEGKSPALRDLWISGKPQPAVDWQIIKATDEAVVAYAAQLKEKDDKRLVLALGGQVCPDNAEPPRGYAGDPSTTPHVALPGYCGLHCIYAVLRLSGASLAFTELLKPEYLGSTRGSSLSELKRAIEDHQLHAESVGRLTIGDLKASAYPLVLHVKRSHESVGYDHYVLFLGMEDGQAVVCDPPKLQRVTLSSLTSRWDGAALAISSEGVKLMHLVGHGRVLFLVCCLTVLSMVGLIRMGRRFFPLQRLSPLHRWVSLPVLQAAVLAIALALIASSYHLTRDTGLLGKASACELVREAHVTDFLPRVELARVEALQAEGVTFVDARRRPDYDGGHLRGAISLPVDANESVSKGIIGTLPRASRVVVYCQSRHCQFADLVARQLVRDNFRDVSILRGGWYEWSQWKARKENLRHGLVEDSG